MTDTKSKSSCLAWLKSIDMFGVPIRLHIHHQKYHRTLCSGFLSLVVIVAVGVSALTMIIDALFYANINFLSTLALSSNTIIRLNSTNFVMAARFNDPAISLNNSMYSITFNHVLGNQESGQAQLLSLGAIPCTREYLNLHRTELDSLNISNMVCPNYTLYNIGAKETQYIQISVKKCQNYTNSPIICAPQEELDAYFSTPSVIKPVPVSLYITNNILDMLNYHPNIRYFKELSFKLPGGNIGRQSDLFIFEELVSVENTILNTLKNGIEVDDSFTIEEKTSDQIVYAVDGSFLEVNIKKSELQKNYVRSFTKFEEILAFLGGLSKALVIIASIVAIPINQFYYNLAIANEIYEFESRPKIYYQKTLKDNWRKTSKTFSSLDGFSAKKDDPVGEMNIPFHRRVIQNEKVQQYHPFFESLLFRHHRLHYTIREAIKNFFCCVRRNLQIKADLYRQAEQRLRKDVDIITILRKLQDIDKLKELLLNNDQLELFNYKKPLRIEYLGRLKVINQIPLITKRKRPSDPNPREETPNRKSLYLHDRSLDTVEHFRALFEAYKVVSKDNSSILNAKLSEMLGPELLKIFQKLDSDYQSDMAVITRKSSQLNKADLEGVISYNNPPSSENLSRIQEGAKEDDSHKSVERCYTEEAPYTFNRIDGHIISKPKARNYQGSMVMHNVDTEECEDNKSQGIHVNVKNPKYPMKNGKHKEMKPGAVSFDNLFDIKALKEQRR